MVLFVTFIFGTIIIGAGFMLAPAWPTKHPRIGLNAALALGLVMGGGIFWAMLVAWDTLVIDYLLFALVTGIFLGGTLSYGQKRAEARGETLSDEAQGWPGLRDLLFFLLVFIIFIIPAVILPVPLDTDAQGFGYLALMTRLGGSFNTLAPFNPDVTYLYAPGFTLIAAYLSQQIGAGLHIVQFSIGVVLAVLAVWLAFDYGSELRDKRLGRAMAIAMLIGLGLFTAFMDSHFTTLLALVFALAFLTYTLRYLREEHIADALAAVIMLGGVVLSHPDTTIILALGYGPWLLTMWCGTPRPTTRTWLVLAVGIPGLTLLGLLPWLINIRDLLGGDIVSPFERFSYHWRVMTQWPYHGVWIVLLAAVGLVVGLRKRNQGSILAVMWLLLILDFSTLGLLERAVPFLVEPLLRYDYPFSIAWHGPIIPYTILGGIGLLWIWEQFLERRLGAALHRYAPALITGAIVLAVGGAVLHQDILAFSKDRITFFGAFSSAADVDAMLWLRDNTPKDARVLNFPGPQEGDWVPVIAERDSVYYRPQPFFRGDEDDRAEQERFRAFWHDPANPQHARLLAEAGIDYVIVPQIVTNPASLKTMFRWREPFTNDFVMRSQVADAPYLELRLDIDGAQVYEFVGE
ncbi:MAG: hypothetical protein D6737_20795 [Chloroflexi bacterium]|nr:MAG: hypothetical protein D6737_20795 [Chloroflexota bacterium]